jgi:hypothetical protein
MAAEGLAETSRPWCSAAADRAVRAGPGRHFARPSQSDGARTWTHPAAARSPDVGYRLVAVGFRVLSVAVGVPYVGLIRYNTSHMWDKCASAVLAYPGWHAHIRAGLRGALERVRSLACCSFPRSSLTGRASLRSQPSPRLAAMRDARAWRSQRVRGKRREDTTITTASPACATTAEALQWLTARTDHDRTAFESRCRPSAWGTDGPMKVVCCVEEARAVVDRRMSASNVRLSLARPCGTLQGIEKGCMTYGV